MDGKLFDSDSPADDDKERLARLKGQKTKTRRLAKCVSGNSISNNKVEPGVHGETQKLPFGAFDVGRAS